MCHGATGGTSVTYVTDNPGQSEIMSDISVKFFVRGVKMWVCAGKGELLAI